MHPRGTRASFVERIPARLPIVGEWSVGLDEGVEVGLGAADGLGAGEGDDAAQAVGGGPEPAVGSEGFDLVAEVCFGAVVSAGEGEGVVVAGLAGWPLGS